MRQMTENVIIGGAFPALFGGGLGAIAGGAAGGLIPGNPMLSIATSALGGALDQLAASVIKAGASMLDPISNFDELAESGLIASRSQQKYIQQLIEAGRVTEAAALIQEELIKKVGVEGALILQKTAKSGEALNAKMAELGLQIQAAVAGPLNELLTWFNSFIGSVVSYNRRQAAQTDFLTALRKADPNAYQQYFKESIALKDANQGKVDPGALKALQQKYTQAYNLEFSALGMNVDKTAEQKALGETQELRAQVDLTAKKLTLTGMTFEKNGEAYIAAAKNVALQEYENKLLEIKNSWIGKAYDAEIDTLMIRNAYLEYAAKLKSIETERVKNLRDELDIQRSIFSLYSERLSASLETGNLDVQMVRLTKGTEAANTEELRQLQARLNLEELILYYRKEQRLLQKDLTKKEIDLVNNVYNAQVNNLKTQYDIRQRTIQQAEAERRLNKFTADEQSRQNTVENFERLRKERTQEIEDTKMYLRLVTEGVLPAEAERLVKFERFVSDQLTAIEQQIKITNLAIVQAEAYGASADKIKELRDELERLQEARGTVLNQAVEGPGKKLTPKERLTTAIGNARGELNDLVDTTNQVIGAAETVGNAFAQSFKALISGTQTAQEALAQFFKNVGDYFLETASKIIGKLIEIFILEQALGLISGAVGKRGTPGATAPSGKEYYGPAFAEGGFVTGPTRALIGEGGESEYVIPASKMKSAMNRYAAGARGNAVLSGGDETSGGGTATMAPAAIDVRYNVERINNVDYVTNQEFQAGLQQAASQGAERGQQLALRRLQQSVTTRRRLGI
jgi:hypothetical protein